MSCCASYGSPPPPTPHPPFHPLETYENTTGNHYLPQPAAKTAASHTFQRSRQPHHSTFPPATPLTFPPATPFNAAAARSGTQSILPPPLSDARKAPTFFYIRLRNSLIVQSIKLPATLARAPATGRQRSIVYRIHKLQAISGGGGRARRNVAGCCKILQRVL